MQEVHYLFFLYDKVSIKMHKLFSIAYKNRRITTKQLSKELACHSITTNKIINIFNEEFEQPIYVKNGSIYEINNSTLYTYTPYTYYFKLATTDASYQVIAELFFSDKRYTLESLSQKLHISRSKLYNVILHLNKKLEPFDLSIQLNSYILVSGPSYAIVNFIFELLLMEKKTIDHRIIQISDNIFQTFKLKKVQTIEEYYQNWVQAFVIYKFMKKRDFIFVEDKVSDYVSLDNFMKAHSVFCQQIDSIKKLVPNQSFYADDYYILFSGIFISSNYLSNHSWESLVYKNFSLVESTVDGILTHFNSSTKTTKNVKILERSLYIILLNYPFHKIRYSEFTTTQNLSKCPSTIKHKLKKNKQFQLFCRTFRCTSKQQNILIDIFWYVFKLSEDTLRSVAKTKFMFKSVNGKSKEQIIKKLFLDTLFHNDSIDTQENSNIVYIVDDDRLLESENTISLDCFMNTILNI